MILNRYERMIARRYLLPGQGRGVHLPRRRRISLVAVALGVAALIIVMSVMNGFRAELFDKIVGLNGHAIIQGYDGRLADWQQIADARPQDARRHVGDAADRAAADGLAPTAGSKACWCAAMRVEDIRTNPIAQRQGRSPATCSSITPGSGRVAIGSRLAETLGAFPGSEITLISPEGRSTAGRHRAAHRHLHRRRDLRGRRLRI